MVISYLITMVSMQVSSWLADEDVHKTGAQEHC